MFKKINFVVINILSSGILFARSVLFLKYMPENELGIIMLFQAIIAVFGLVQIGLFNGGLRIFAIDNEFHLYKEVNNSNVTYILSTTILFLISLIIFNIFTKFNITIFILSAIIGCFALLNNWFSNILIARKKLKEINIINLTSSIISAILSFTIFIWGIVGALLSISSLYIVFVVMFIIREKEFRPTHLEIKFKILKKQLAFGFIPFLSGIAVLLNNQIDRFFIANAISLKALGQFYLAVTFITIFDLFPSNLNTLFSPIAINNYSEGKLKETVKITKTYFLLLILYSIIAGFLVILIGNKIISIIFPDKINQLKYLFIMLPGIIAVTLSKPFSFILFIALNLKSILWSNIFSLTSYLFSLIILLNLSYFTIENIAYLKSVQGILVFIFLIISTIYSWNKIKNFYYINN